MRPAISVVICTLNRARLLRQAVQSVLDQELAPEEFEVIVVDNGSTDETAVLIAAMMKQHPNLRLVREPAVGLSNARNRGAREAGAPFVAFLDDDAVATDGWLSAHLGALCAADGPVATGGPVWLCWPGERPNWIPAERESFYSGLDLGRHPHRLAYPQFPYGANMAVRRDALEEVGGFSTRLGRRGTDLVSGEERELFRRLAARGGTITYVPGAAVYHHVLPERVRRRWLIRRSFAQGRSEVLLQSLAGGSVTPVGASARAAWRTMVGMAQGLAAALAVGTRQPPDEVMRRVCRGAQSFGAGAEHARAVARSLRRVDREADGR